MGKFDGIKISVPKFTAKLPSTNKKVNFTPFRVGDEKTLLIASQSDNPVEMLHALKSIVENCVDYPIDDMEQYDIEFMFLQLRAKSVGETSDVGVSCLECQAFNQLTVNLDTVLVDKPANHTNIIKISDEIAMEMKQSDPEAAASLDLSNPDDLFRLVCLSTKTVYSGEDAIEVEPTDHDDLKELLESMTADQFDTIQEYFRTMPKLSKPISFTCGSCGHENEQVLEGLSSFF